MATKETPVNICTQTSAKLSRRPLFWARSSSVSFLNSQMAGTSNKIQCGKNTKLLEGEKDWYNIKKTYLLMYTC